MHSRRLQGSIVSELANIGHAYDLFLMHFSTAMNKILEIREFLQKFKTLLIIDESHNIKSPKLRRWASSALEISESPWEREKIQKRFFNKQNSSELPFTFFILHFTCNSWSLFNKF